MAHDAFGLDGSVAVVTGGSRGIGEATAVALAEAGADVAPVARSADELADTAERVEAAGGAAHPVELDVTDSAGVAALFGTVEAELGPVDVLVNNAGTNPFFGDARDLDTDTWEHIFAVNVRGAFECAREFGRRVFDREGSGALVNVASVGGVRGLARQVPYVASKHALVGMTKTLAVDWAPDVRVNALAPGYVKTDLTEGVRENESIRADLLAEIPQDRFADPEEVATGAVYLASDAAAYVTGEVHLADGGMAAN
jgi:NAD(P)-dependent dehydrogenase (short-subunit alcohol dehydrogenase family)